MKSDLLQDAIGLVKDEYIEDAHGAQSDAKVRWKPERQQLMFWGRWAAGVCAALLVVVGVWKSGVIKEISDYPFWQNGTEGESTEESVGETREPNKTEEPTIETPEMTEEEPTEEPTETEDPIYNEDTLWLGGNGDPIEGLNMDFSLHVEKGIKLSKYFKEVLEQAEDTDRIAFVVSDGNHFDPRLEGALLREKREAGEEMYQVKYACWERLEEQYGISGTEARARTFSEPDFVETRNRLREVIARYNAAHLMARYQERQFMLDEVIKQGFTVLYTAEDETYQQYLYSRSGLGVLVGTKAEILALENLELPYLLKLYPASSDAAEYPVSTFEYTGEDITLSGDSKLTVELVEAFEQSAGAAIEVVIHVGFINIEIKGWDKSNSHELEALVYEALGLTKAEYLELYDGDWRYWAERYTEAKNRITHYADYQENVAKNYLLEGELVEVDYLDSEIRAVLTYERALEISKHKEIGYIDLKEK